MRKLINLLLVLGMVWMGVAPVGAERVGSDDGPRIEMAPGQLVLDGGVNTMCAVFDGAGRCWGANTTEGLGIGVAVEDTAFVPWPAAVAGLGSDIADIEAVHGFGCALKTNGSVWCWGDNSSGQLGNHTADRSTTPVEVQGLGFVTRLARGVRSAHMCAIEASGVLKCWGANSYGQLGDGTTEPRWTAVAVQGLSGSIDAAVVFGASTCALVSSSVWCWGANTYGQLGDGSTTLRLTPTLVSGSKRQTSALSAGMHSACAVIAGELRCWGRNDYGQLGDGTQTQRLTPVAVVGLVGSVSAIDMGDAHSCALIVPPGAPASEPRVWCWGLNTYHQVSPETTIFVLTPQEGAVTTFGAVGLSVGSDHGCVVLADTTIRCWGANSYGQLGLGNTTSPIAYAKLLIKQAPGLESLESGTQHTCVTFDHTGNRCWGEGGSYQLGTGVAGLSSTPVAPSGLRGGGLQTDGGLGHSCRIGADGAIHCWGANQYGQVGDGTNVTRMAPELITIDTNVRGASVALTQDSSCVLAVGGSVYCWGRNNEGQLGNASNADSTTPVQPLFSEPVVELAGGARHMCARLESGQVRCWGSNDHGQLGNGTNTDQGIPSLVVGISDAVELAAGEAHTCALLRSGGVKCWGSNSRGQLGNGDWSDSWTPTPVSYLNSVVVALGSGGRHTCASFITGSIVCWGDNRYGQLGDGTTTMRRRPVLVVGLSDALLITGGSDHTCMGRETAAGPEVWCWGYNQAGQLGNGTLMSTRTPTKVLPIMP